MNEEIIYDSVNTETLASHLEDIKLDPYLTLSIRKMFQWIKVLKAKHKTTVRKSIRDCIINLGYRQLLR